MGILDGKVALVRAATQGIGRASAIILAKHGASVYIGGQTIESGEEVVKEIEKSGGRAKALFFEATQIETYESIVEETVRAEGKIDILVNNYGRTNVKKDFDLLKGDTETFFEILKDNIQSVYLPSKAAIPYMIKNGSGSIVNISSIGAILPDVSRLAYGVSKAGINFLTQNIAVQYARQNIRCNAIMPGLIATNSAINSMSKDFIDTFLKHVPIKRFGKPEDIANAVLFFASDQSAFITGETLPVAGGYGLPAPLYGDNVTQ